MAKHSLESKLYISCSLSPGSRHSYSILQMRKCAQYHTASKPQKDHLKPTYLIPKPELCEHEWTRPSESHSSLEHRVSYAADTGNDRGQSAGKGPWSFCTFAPSVISVLVQRCSIHLDHAELLDEKTIKCFKVTQVTNATNSLNSLSGEGDWRWAGLKHQNASLFQKTLNSADGSSLRHGEVSSEMNISYKVQ